MGPGRRRVLRIWCAMVISEARFGGILLAVGLVISIAVYLAIGNAGGETNRSSSVNSFQEPNSQEQDPEMVFSPTGKYVAADPSMPLILHAFEVTPDYISVVYTLVGGPKETPQSFSPTIVDDKGQTYRILGNAFLGSVDGVLAGLLVVEPHIPGGSVLTIEANKAEMAGGAPRDGPWSIAFLQTNQPDAPITFIEGGRLSPEEGVTVNGATVGIAGPPGSSPVEVLVNRNGRTTSLFGMVDQEGAARAIGQNEFRGILGVSGYPKPPAFPTTPAASP